MRELRFATIWVLVHLLLAQYFESYVSLRAGFQFMYSSLFIPLLYLGLGYIQDSLLRIHLRWRLNSWPMHCFRGGMIGLILIAIGEVMLRTDYFPTPVILSLGIYLGQIWAFPKAKQRWIWLGANIFLSAIQFGGMILFNMIGARTQFYMWGYFGGIAVRLLCLLIQALILFDLKKLSPETASAAAPSVTPKPRLFMLAWIILSMIFLFPWMGFVYMAYPNFLPFIIVPALSAIIPALQSLLFRYWLRPVRWWADFSLYGATAGLYAAFWVEIWFSGMQIGAYAPDFLAIPLFSSAYLAFRLILAIMQSISLGNWKARGLWIAVNLLGAVLVWIVMIFNWPSYPFNAMNVAGFIAQLISAALSAYTLVYVMRRG